MTEAKIVDRLDAEAEAKRPSLRCLHSDPSLRPSRLWNVKSETE